MSERFTITKTPPNSLTILRWIISEPVLLNRYADSLSTKETISHFLNAYLLGSILTAVVYFLGATIVTGLNFPTHYPDLFSIPPNSLSRNVFFTDLTDFVFRSYKILGLCLVVGLIAGLLGCLTTGLKLGLVLGVTTGWSLGLTGSLAVGMLTELFNGFTASLAAGGIACSAAGLTIGIGAGLIFKLTSSSPYGLIAGLVVGLLAGFLTGTIGSLAAGLVAGSSGGVIAGVTSSLAAGMLVFFIAGVTAGGAFYLAYFRMLLYPFHFFYSIVNRTLECNILLKNGAVWIPLPLLSKSLINEAKHDNSKGREFARFLFEHRPIQRKLAFRISHSSTAGMWFYSPLNVENFTSEISYAHRIKSTDPIPSITWYNALENARKSLIAAQKQNNAGLREESWEQFHISLRKFEYITLNQAEQWKDDYLWAIRKWIKESEKEKQRLSLRLKDVEPITKNIYRTGVPLRPNEYGAQTFIGRDDLHIDLGRKIRMSATMPTFLLQGQRRVGKTSLLNFLPDLLGPGFLIISKDMQQYCDSVTACFSEFIKIISETIPLKSYPDPLPEDGLEAWLEFRVFIQEVAQQINRKIILAIDEYETFHKLLKKEGKIAEDLLADMRNFSQHQNQVVLLFTGLYIFADLGEPDFSRFFVHVHRIKVDYLTKKDAAKLIRAPSKDFSLTYPSELVEQICELTAGHPALLQQIGSEMVDRANAKEKKHMDAEDLNYVLNNILKEDNDVMTTFWIHFCNASLQQTVKEIIAGHQPTDRANLLQLLGYGFIEKIDGNQLGRYMLRVPLVEKWIGIYGERFRTELQQ